MKIFELLRNPLVKGIGIIAILYFALFANTQHPNSLGNRLSSENVKKDLADVTSKSSFIISNVRTANEMAKNRNLQSQTDIPSSTTQTAEISTEDLEIGSGDKTLSCGDEANFSYGIYSKSGQQLDFVESQKIIIGSQKNLLFEKNISGMKNGGIRYINVPHNSSVTDQKVANFLLRQNEDLKIQITLLSFVTTAEQNLHCN